MGRQGKTLKYLLMILLLLVGCVTPVLATVDFQVTPVYQLLAWSPDETEIKCSDCGLITTKEQLIKDNNHIIEANIEDFKEEIIKQLQKDLKKIFK